MGANASLYEGRSSITVAGITGSLQQIITLLSNQVTGNLEAATKKG
jgi:hypothetical protein